MNTLFLFDINALPGEIATHLEKEDARCVAIE